MDTLQTILSIVFVAVAVVMVIFILLQEGKGGGLTSLGGTRAAGVEGVTNPVRRATAVLAAIFFLLAILLGVLSRSSGQLTGDTLFNKPAASANKKDDAGLKFDPQDIKLDFAPPKGNEAKSPLEGMKFEVIPQKGNEAKPVVPDAKTETPKAEVPKADAPKADAPKPDATKKP